MTIDLNTVLADLQTALADAQTVAGNPKTYTFSQIGSPLAPLVDSTSWSAQYRSGTEIIGDITNTWNGAAFDYATGTMHVVAAGGHGNSWINQSFARNSASGAWSKTAVQTAFPPDQHVSGYAPTYWNGTMTNGNGYEADATTPVTPYVNGAAVYFDGKPASRHIYGGTVWLPTQQRVLLISGSQWHLGNGDNYCGWFDPVAGTWTRKGNTPVSYTGISSAYDKVRDVVYWNRQGTTVYKYDPATDVHTHIGTTSPDPLWADLGPNVQLCCDGTCTYLYATIMGGWKAKMPSLPAIYANAIVRMKLGQTGLQTWEPVAVTDDTSILYANDPGFEFDPDLNAFVLWSPATPAALSILDLTTFAITNVPIAGTAPTAAQLADCQHGTWGRFRRVSTGAYAVMVSANAPLYRITAG